MQAIPLKVPSGANEDLRAEHLLPKMAEVLSSSPVDLDDPEACEACLKRDFRLDDVNDLLVRSMLSARSLRRPA
jgi:hypothetical protein